MHTPTATIDWRAQVLDRFFVSGDFRATRPNLGSLSRSRTSAGSNARASTKYVELSSEPEDDDKTVPPTEQFSSAGRNRDDSQILNGSQRFRVLRQLAKGGLGQVSVAFDNQRHREVALKEIRYELADDPTCRVRFLQEAAISESLDHPNIVPVHATGTFSDGRPYYIMRLVSGPTLKSEIQSAHAKMKDDYALDEIVALVHRLLATCEAIAYAHQKRVVHRDIKPSNIMLEGDRTFVVDWGLAHRLPAYQSRDIHLPATSGEDVEQAANDDSARDSGAWPSCEMPRPDSSLSDKSTSEQNTPSARRRGQAVGTPAYMSPEQVSGATTGIATDVFGLGATLYHLLTGVPPHSDRTPSTFKNIEKASFPNPRKIQPRIPRDLEAICLKAMSRSPKQRYPSATQLANDLHRWLNGDKVDAKTNRLVRFLGGR